MIDYESSSLVPKSIVLKEEVFICQKFNSVFETRDSKFDSYSQKLCQILISDSNFQIKPNLYSIENNLESPITENPAWFVYKSSKCPEKGKKYKINQGDIIKIGRITCRIKEIKFNVQNNQNNNNNNSCNTNINIRETVAYLSRVQTEKNMKCVSSERLQVKNKKKLKKNCRICYSDDDTEENPLVQPCQCSGTMRNIHLECLRQWLSTRICQKVSSNEDSSIFQIKRVECELCKSQLPDYLRHAGKLYEILDFHSEFDNYLTLESLTLDKHQNKFLYVISLDNKDIIKVGRGHDSNLLLSDISVSRIHCIFHKEKNNIFLEDNDSKFGTLILVQSPIIHLDENVPLHLQIGRTYISTKIKRPFSLFGCCSISETSDEYVYQRQNAKHIDYQNKVTIHEEKDADENEENEINDDDISGEKNNGFLKVIEPEKEEEEEDKGIVLGEQKLRKRKSTIFMENADLLQTIPNNTENMNEENLVHIPFRSSTRDLN